MHCKVKSFQYCPYKNFANKMMEDLIRYIWESITSKKYLQKRVLWLKILKNSHKDYELDNLIAKPRVKENILIWN